MKWLGPAPFVAFLEYACVSYQAVWDFTCSFSSCWTTLGRKSVRDCRSYAVILQELAVDSIQPKDNDTAFFSNSKRGPILAGSNLQQVIELCLHTESLFLLRSYLAKKVRYAPEILSIQTATELDFKLLVFAECLRVCKADALQLPQTRHLGSFADIYNLSPNITIRTGSKTPFPVDFKYIATSSL